MTLLAGQTIVLGGSVALYVQSAMPRNTASASRASAHRSIFRLRSSNIVDVHQTSRAQLKPRGRLHSMVRSIGLGTSMPDELSVSDWCGAARQLCTQNA